MGAVKCRAPAGNAEKVPPRSKKLKKHGEGGKRKETHNISVVSSSGRELSQGPAGADLTNVAPNLRPRADNGGKDMGLSVCKLRAVQESSIQVFSDQLDRNVRVGT